MAHFLLHVHQHTQQHIAQCKVKKQCHTGMVGVELRH